MSISPELRHKIEQSKVLLVGAGGIGCEVLKNLTLAGFRSIDAVDLDTIDVSNLNRQFLFNKSNVGQSKAQVAIDIAKREYAPSSTDELYFIAFHKSIMLSEFDVDFFRQYSFVINALDNRAARSHVNRMCLAAEVPLLESGTAGYTGQSKLIKNSLTACYECDGIMKESTTYATCTIRNTPSQPIHCIVWAKHLFHQLFGEDDPDNDVSPQMESSEHDQSDTNNSEQHNLNGNSSNGIETTIDESEKGDKNDNESTQNKENGTNKLPDVDHDKPPSRKVSTREWATQNNYDSAMLIQKLFNDDINYLLSMDNLWKERAKPTPLDYSSLIQDGYEEAQCSKNIANDDLKMGNQRLWTLRECVDIFADSVAQLHQRMKTSGFQQWDKDDDVALNFVVSASNLRSKCFNIERKSPFDVKSLAGNIVPAISSTNSIIGGLLVLQAIRLLKQMPLGEEYRKLEDSARNELLKDSDRLSYLNYTSLNRQDLIASYPCLTPLPTCLTCAKGNTPEVGIHLSMQNTTLADLVDKIVIGTFHFVCPDLCLNDDSGTIIWSKDESEDGEGDETRRRKLVELPHIKAPKTRLLVSDLIQDKELVLVLMDEKIDEEKHKNFFYASMGGNELT